ncbi:3-dehydroquinate synthase [Elusimicrobiota bacterium]
MKKLSVNLGKRSYPIFIGPKISELGHFLRKSGFSGKVFIITNPTVAKLYLEKLEKSLEKAGFDFKHYQIPDGEQHKNMETLEKIYKSASISGIDRKSFVIALGGGVVGDVAGFFAATYMRGLQLIQVPTTLLAMVDSSVGGKTGIDLGEGKNLVGAFYQPKAVWIDTLALKTLPERQIRNGLAEVIKYGVIKDSKFFSYLEKNIVKFKKIKSAEWEKIIYRCCQIKAQVVEDDEKEHKGIREVLNFGHTFGHAIETLTKYKKYYHGEAIALGMSIAAKLAVKKGLFSEKDRMRLDSLLLKTELTGNNKAKFSPNTMILLMLRDKKVRDGVLRFVLPTKIGEVKIESSIPVKLIREVL